MSKKLPRPRSAERIPRDPAFDARITSILDGYVSRVRKVRELKKPKPRRTCQACGAPLRTRRAS